MTRLPRRGDFLEVVSVELEASGRVYLWLRDPTNWAPGVWLVKVRQWSPPPALAAPYPRALPQRASRSSGTGSAGPEGVAQVMRVFRRLVD